MNARIFLLILLACSGVLPVLGEEGAKIGASYRALLGAAQAAPSNEALVSLGEAISTLSRYDFHDEPDRSVLIAELVNGMIAIPGHARAFADEIERGREQALQVDPSARGSYNMTRSRYLSRVLRHLPSPETLQVLGHYLEDERDTPSEDLPHEGTRERDFVSSPENAWHAFSAISNLGLRDAPMKPTPSAPSGGYRHGTEMTDAMRRTREWFVEVKEGKRAFSFLGQRVEYRFKPDGTWKTTPLAISDEAIREELNPPAPVAAAPTPAPVESVVPTIHEPTSSKWPWIAGAAALLVAIGAWLIGRMKR